jgi:hypothetical protein
MAENLKLGDRVRHRVNGFEGIATGITEYLQQCRQILVTPEKLDKDGKVLDSHWYDEPWLDLVLAGVYRPKAAAEYVAPSGARFPVSGAPNRPHPPSR